jgi:hypothetical protein
MIKNNKILKILPLIQVPPMIQNKNEVLNLKSRKTQVLIGYLTLLFFQQFTFYFLKILFFNHFL